VHKETETWKVILLLIHLHLLLCLLRVLLLTTAKAGTRRVKV
jgi:hypothetical protein